MKTGEIVAHGLALLVVASLGALAGSTSGRRALPNHGKFIPISAAGAKMLGDKMGVNWSRVPLEEFRRGVEVEQEHWETVGGSFEKIAEIALAHIEGTYGLDPGEKGLADYYDRLDAMEEAAEAKNVYD